MKAKVRVQQPFKKIDTPRHITIKINQPSSIHQNYNAPADVKEISLPAAIQQEIKEVQSRIEVSQQILQQSRRQANSPSKIVPSDSMPIRFNYQSAKSYPNNFGLFQLDERDSQDSLENGSEGSIQLPIHLVPADDRDYMTTRREGKANTTDFKHQYSTEKQMPSWRKDRGLSLEKKSFNRSIQQARTPKTNSTIGPYKYQFIREKELYKSKDRMLNDGERNKLQNFLISVEEELTHRSKEKKAISRRSNGSGNSKGQERVKIKLNHPTGSKPRTESSYLIRPRYHIEMPEEKWNRHQNPSSKKEQMQIHKNDWEELKSKLERYEFIRKYLNESELHQIYQYLKKNHINQQKWPLFVVDEAYKKMNSTKHR